MVFRGFIFCCIAASGLAHEPALAQFSDAPGDWKPQSTKEGITLERRAVPGSKFYEYRAVVAIAVEPELAAEDIWRALRGSDMETLKRRDILRESPDELLIYDQIRTPIVNDRDYVITVKREHDATARRTRFRCATVSGVGPPAAPKHVRIPIIRAGWMVEPGAHGGTQLTYYAYSEPGGLITAFLARGAQADRSMADVVHMTRRLRKLAR